MTDPIAPLRQKFRARLVEDLARLRELTAQTSTPVGEMRVLAHNLAGAAGTFGYPDLSAAAVVLDDHYVVGETPSEAELAALDQAIRKVIAET